MGSNCLDTFLTAKRWIHDGGKNACSQQTFVYYVVPTSDFVRNQIYYLTSRIQGFMAEMQKDCILMSPVLGENLMHSFLFCVLFAKYELNTTNSRRYIWHRHHCHRSRCSSRRARSWLNTGESWALGGDRGRRRGGAGVSWQCTLGKSSSVSVCIQMA